MAPALESKVQRANEQFAKIGSTDRENALRGVFLGGLFEQIKGEAGHGTFLKLARERMPEIPQERRNELMRLWGVFVRETKVAVPKQLAIPDAQLALALDAKATQDELVGAALNFVGEQSLHALMVEKDVIGTKALGGKRTKGGNDKPAAPTAEELERQAKADISLAVEGLRAVLITDNMCRHLEAKDIRSLDTELNGLVARWRRAVKSALKD